MGVITSKLKFWQDSSFQNKVTDLSWYSQKITILIRSLLICGICYIILFPVLAKISSSFMTRADLWDQTVTWIPKYGTLNNFLVVFERLPYPEAFINTLLLAIMVSTLQLISCTLVGYGFARFKFRGRELLFALVIVSLVIPPEMIAIPMYLNFRFFDFYGLFPQEINLLNTFWPFVFTSITGTGLRNGFFIYIMRQFFKGVPRDLEEAAYVDGAGALKTFYRVMLPGAGPAMIVVFLFAFVWQWNDYFQSSLFLRNAMVLPIRLSVLPNSVFGRSDLYTRIPEEVSVINNTGSLMVIAPLVILYMFLQRYFVESVERTGLGG